MPTWCSTTHRNADAPVIRAVNKGFGVADADIGPVKDLVRDGIGAQRALRFASWSCAARA